MFPVIRRFAAALVGLGVGISGCSKPPAKEAGTLPDTATQAAPGVVDSMGTSANLRGTDWRLVALGDKAVTPPADTQRVAHIILQPDAKTVAGSGGCNRLFGVYELTGEALRFSGIGSTKMACKEGMETEAAFLPVLLRVRRWKIAGQRLELSDSTGAVVARFEARPGK